MHDFGDTGHADAANADEMDRADVGADTLHAFNSETTPSSQRKLGSLFSSRATETEEVRCQPSLA
jgi:hypothetical protein